MTKAVFLDRDGTINEDKDYLYRIEDFRFMPGVIEGLRLLQRAGYLLIIITNQSGIARGYYTEEDFFHLNHWMLKELGNKGIAIKKVYYCPHHPDAVISKYRKLCICRKPSVGLFRQAVKDFDIDLSNSIAIGDKIRDCSICDHSSCRGYLVGVNEKTETINDVKSGKFHGVMYKDRLIEAARDIVAMNWEG